MHYILLFTSVFLAIAGQFTLKSGIMASQLTPTIEGVIKTILTPLVFLGFVLYGVSSIMWLFVLQKFPLSVAYPTAAISYVVIVTLSAVFLNEQLTIYKIIGVVLISLGVAVLARGA